MKIIFISDTHGRHKDVQLPEGDILVHCGDISKQGRLFEVKNFLEWYSERPHKYKILIAGNHDFFFEKAESFMINNEMPENIIYLNDSGIKLMGLKIWGSPIQPEFCNWAFNRARGKEIKKHWDLIPNDTDILITHGPPYGILDKTIRGINVGCEELLKRVNQIKPSIHAFGHIHEAFGLEIKNNIKFVNASLLNHRYYYTNKPITINF